jgi:hypothetical protein
VFPVWLFVRVFKMLGRENATALLDPNSRNREA